MNFRTLSLLFLLGLMACKSQQEATLSIPPSPETAANQLLPPTLLSPDEESTWTPLRLEKWEISVQIVGTVATTTFEMVFANDANRQREGRFFFPLGPNKRVSRFALDIEGQMREAVAVEKSTARKAYESVVRKQVDPALLEWSRDNAFQARVFPIPAQGSRRILLAYQEELPLADGGWQYQFPQLSVGTVDSVSLKLEVIQAAQAPTIQSGTWPSLLFHGQDRSYVAEAGASDFSGNLDLSIFLPPPAEAAQVFVQETGPEESWFYVQGLIQPELRRRSVPRRLGLIYDRSHSAHRRDWPKEQAALTAYFQQIGTVEVELLSFAVDQRSEGVFSVLDGDWSELEEAILALPKDGATDFGSVHLQTHPADGYLLLSDGLHTFGKNSVFPSEIPVDVLCASRQAEIGFLQRIATASGGHFLDLNEQSPEWVAYWLQHLPYRLISMSYDRGELQEVHTTFTPGDQHISVVGKLLTNTASLVLNFGIGPRVSQQIIVPIDKSQHLIGAVGLPRLWAETYLQELEAQSVPERETILNLGKTYGLLTRETSLLVLESVEDYVENRIPPPAELLPRYEQLVEQEEKNRRFEMMSQLDLVAEAFQARKEWWATNFEIPAEDFFRDPEKKNRESADDDWGATEGSFDDWGGDEEGEVTGNSLEEMFAEPEAKPSETKATEGSIEIAPWNPDTPYLRALKAVSVSDAYALYLQQKIDYGQSPAFYLDVANFFWQAGDSSHAVQVLSNLAEWQLDQHELLRIMGRLLLQWGEKEAALAAFEQVLALRPEEPQSLRDLALAHHHLQQNQQAIAHLYQLSRQAWDDRFPNIGLLAVHEMNAIIGQSQQKLDLSKIDPRLLADLPTDLRVVIDWDQDGADMDLWVTDPRGERSYYQHKQTEIGGLMSEDFTGGYGPEEFLLHRAIPGTYEVKVNYYGSNSAEWIGPVTVQAELILDYGRKTERRKTISLRLEQENEVFLLGELQVE